MPLYRDPEIMQMDYQRKLYREELHIYNVCRKDLRKAIKEL